MAKKPKTRRVYPGLLDRILARVPVSLADLHPAPAIKAKRKQAPQHAARTLPLWRRLQNGGGQLTKNYGFEWEMLRVLRPWRDGIDFLTLECGWDRFEDDHKPSAGFRLVVLNLTLLELNVYYLYHRDELEIP